MVSCDQTLNCPCLGAHDCDSHSSHSPVTMFIEHFLHARTFKCTVTQCSQEAWWHHSALQWKKLRLGKASTFLFAWDNLTKEVRVRGWTGAPAA